MSTPTQRHLRSLAGRALLRLAAALASAQGTLVRLASSASRTPRPDPKDTARAAGDGMDTDMPDPATPDASGLPPPDLQWVSTEALFCEIARRQEACLLVGVRQPKVIHGRRGVPAAFLLSSGIGDARAFLRYAYNVFGQANTRPIREGDL